MATDLRPKPDAAAAFRRGIDNLIDGCMSAALDDACRRRRSHLDDDDLAESSAAARRHSRTLGHWAAFQAEEIMIISTIERRNRESELMALAGLHTVSMLDPSFLYRTTSPQPTPSPPAASGAASAVLRRWRQLEDDSAAAAREQRSTTNRIGTSVSDEAEESDYDRASSREQSPDLGDGDRERVRQIIRDWTAETGDTSPRSESPRGEWLGETERERVRLVRQWVHTASRQRDAQNGGGRAEPEPQPDREGSEAGQQEHAQRDPLRLRGRQARLDLIMRIVRERERELQGLVEHRAVSEFAHRNRIQSLLRGRFLRNERPSEDERPSSTAASELGQLRQRHPVSSLRLENIIRGQSSSQSDATASDTIHGSRNDRSQLGTMVLSDDNHVWSQSRNENSDIHQPTEAQTTTTELEFSSLNNIYRQESVTQGENWPEEDAEHGRRDWQQSPEVEYREWSNGAEEESDGNWHENRRQEWFRETLEDEEGDDNLIIEANEEWNEDDSHETVENWQNGSSDHLGGQQTIPSSGVNRFILPDDDNVYNLELRELLSRRSVSNLLHSGFRNSLDQLIQSYVQRQGHAPLDWDLQRTRGNPVSPDEDLGQQRDDMNQGLQDSDARPPLVLPTPPSPPPQPLWHSQFHHTSWNRPSMHRSEIEWETINDLRADISRFQQGMNHMQRMLEACMDMQLELQRSVRQEVSAALNRSIGGQGATEETSGDGSKWAHVRKGTCCVCCDNHIDSLLYRCGHMCTCSKCAYELVQGGGKCPLCRAPIVEVIRAYYIL